MERRSFLSAVAVAPLAPLALKETPQGPPIARAPEVVRLIDWHKPDKNHGCHSTSGLFENRKALAETIRRIKATNKRLGHEREHLVATAVEVTFPGTRYLAADFEWPGDFYPRHSLDVPDYFGCDELGFGYSSESILTKDFFQTREQAMEAVAAFNLKASDKKPYDYWMICLEIGERFKHDDIVYVDLTGGRYGMLNHFPELPVRVVNPTPAEIARYCPDQDWTWTKGGAA